jgi:hypothetical protein
VLPRIVLVLGLALFGCGSPDDERALDGQYAQPDLGPEQLTRLVLDGDSYNADYGAACASCAHARSLGVWVASTARAADGALVGAIVFTETQRLEVAEGQPTTEAAIATEPLLRVFRLLPPELTLEPALRGDGQAQGARDQLRTAP